MSAAPARIRVLLVDDSLFVRKAFARVLSGDPGLQVVGEAADGEEALSRCRQLRPQVVLLDLGMPVLDGLSALRRLRRELPQVAVVVVSAAAQRGAQLALEALEAGAFDLIDKAAVPLMQVHELGAQLSSRIRAAARARRHATGSPLLLPSRSFPAPELVVMAASTGGPLALLALLSRLPADFPAPVALVQHIADGFVEALAARLGQVCPLQVLSPTAREELVPGRAYLPHGGQDFAVVRRAGGALYLQPRPPQPGSPHVPSADTLFESAAAAAGARAWGVLLTGMGADGARGLLSIARRGGLTVAQDEPTSAVWGMPRAAVELGAARAVLPLHEIPSFLTQSLSPPLSQGAPAAPTPLEEA